MKNDEIDLTKSLLAVILTVGGLWGILFAEVGALWFWSRSSTRAEAYPATPPEEEKEARYRSPNPGGSPGDNAAARERLADLRQQWTERIDRVAPPADVRPDFLVAVAEMRERLAAAADRCGVKVAPDAGLFGFSAFAQQPPPVEHRPAVARQLHAVELLTNLLLEAQPRVLLGVQRETSVAASGGGRGPTPRATPEGIGSVARNETFTVDPVRRMRSLAQFKTTGFRFAFCGETETLRRFVNLLVSREWPAVIREIEVTPATAAEANLATSALSDGHAAARTSPAKSISGLSASGEVGAGSSLHPVLSRQWSRFAVTLEWIESLAPTSEIRA